MMLSKELALALFSWREPKGLLNCKLLASARPPLTPNAPPDCWESTSAETCVAWLPLGPVTWATLAAAWLLDVGGLLPGGVTPLTSWDKMGKRGRCRKRPLFLFPDEGDLKRPELKRSRPGRGKRICGSDSTLSNSSRTQRKTTTTLNDVDFLIVAGRDYCLRISAYTVFHWASDVTPAKTTRFFCNLPVKMWHGYR